MKTSQRLIPPLAATIVSGAILCIWHYVFGWPGWVIQLAAGLMLVNLLLLFSWAKNSIPRLMILTCLNGSAIFAFYWYFFKTSLWIVIPGTIFVLAFFFVNSILAKKYVAKSKERVAQWAVANGWQLLEFEHRFDTGPFGGFHGRGEMYFEFVICDQQGNKHTGWARFDHSLFGGGRYEVKWIENPEKQSKY
ncbi:MAG: hypothetical protein L0226_09680 [Acidobacteria bacterium]|nr:hypothetical protein [Acidobacteriota bacterium]